MRIFASIRPFVTLPRLASLFLTALLLVSTSLIARAQDPTIHIVVPGDTLGEIAAAYGTDVETLRELNDMKGNLIRIGQRLIVSEDGGTEAAPASERRPSVPTQPYTVQRGDSLSKIASRFAVTVAEIIQVNDLVNARLIVPGQMLLIPSLRPLATPTDSGADGGSSVEPPSQGKWIDVNLSAQRVTAFEGTKAVRTMKVSTGLPATPTVAGSFRIRLKMPVQDMKGGNRAAGDAYELKGVQWVQYFFEDYAFHGTYWHANFGHPASRGCINMSNEDAEWLFYWTSPDYDADGPAWQGATAAEPGTLVMVHQ